MYSQLLLVTLKARPIPPGCEHHRPSPKRAEISALAVVTKRTDDPLSALHETDDGVLHIDLDSEVDTVILKCADHLEAGAIADVREPWILVAAEIPLEDAPIASAIENGSPGLELPHAIGRLLGVEQDHPPVVDVLTTAHGIGEMGLPVVALVDVRERRGNASFGHDGVGFAEKRLAYEAHGRAARRGFDRRAQSRAPGTDDQDVVLVRLMPIHQRILQSDQTPIEHMRT